MPSNFSHTWLNLLRTILEKGELVAPRGAETREVLQGTLVVDMRRPVLIVPERSLNYRFMAAEAFWILSGSDRVEQIAPFNSRIAEFSDDGETFFGAYGPKIHAQLDYVVDKLTQDPMSRQAGMTIWRENPGPTKDVPCTVAMFFQLRDKKLNAHVFMRSSDAWLGVPYDVFNFSMVAHLICGHLNKDRGLADVVTPGTLYLTAASQHLYAANWDDAKHCASVVISEKPDQPETPMVLWNDHVGLMEWLDRLRFTKPGDDHRWWTSKIK